MMEIFTHEEIRDLAIATLALTIIFSFEPFWGIDFTLFPTYLLIVILTFVFHELAHKFVAMKFQCAAFFKLWHLGILVGLAGMIVGLKFVAPGAVIIYPFQFGRWGFRKTMLTVKEKGVIALAGPLVNLLVALISALLPFKIAKFLFRVNAWLFFSNMIPLPPLDGSKVMEWNPSLWVFLFILGAVMVFL